MWHTVTHGVMSHRDASRHASLQHILCSVASHNVFCNATWYDIMSYVKHSDLSRNELCDTQWLTKSRHIMTHAVMPLYIGRPGTCSLLYVYIRTCSPFFFYLCANLCAHKSILTCLFTSPYGTSTPGTCSLQYAYERTCSLWYLFIFENLSSTVCICEKLCSPLSLSM